MAERDYKKEYQKFQSSTKRKKYRAELNKYNRTKGTYGNGDGKDASHRGNKISGYEAEGKNRGRREKSRLKGSKRKTEGAIMGKRTLREFVKEEAKRDIQEALGKRWNIVSGANPQDETTRALSSIVNKEHLQRAAKEGNTDYIQQIIHKINALRPKLGDEAHDRIDNVMMNLLRIYMKVRNQSQSVVDESGASGTTITEDGSDPQITTYKGWPIYTLPKYTTPYYYAARRRDPKTFKPVFGPGDNFPRLKTLERRIDKMLAKWGKKALDEAESTWGKPEPPSKPKAAEPSKPKPVLDHND